MLASLEGKSWEDIMVAEEGELTTVLILAPLEHLQDGGPPYLEVAGEAAGGLPG